MATRWFVSHPSAAPNSVPTFFRALNTFGAAQKRLEIVLPQREAGHITQTRDVIESSDLVLAEVSLPSTGSGIELGWAQAAGIDIIAFRQGTAVISPSIQFVATAIHAYITEDDVLKILETLR